jgi:hypothetical protein
MTLETMQIKSTTPRVVLRTLMLVGALAAFAGPAAWAEDQLGGHIGFVLPLVTHAGGQTTNLSDNFSIGFPMGITLRGTRRVAFDLELVPSIQDSPRQVTLTVHPGLLYALGHNWAVGTRLAFDVNSSQFGFTPLLHKSFPVENSFIKAYFVEADLPVRFNRPVAGPSTNPVIFAFHLGVGF